MSAILFDLDGVLYESDTVITGAADTIDWFAKNHIPHLFLTNTTSKARSELVSKLARFGITTTEDNFLTPPVAACQLLHSRQLENIAVFVPESTRHEFSEFQDLADYGASGRPGHVDAVIVGDLGRDWTFEILNRMFRILIQDPDMELIALGMTRYWKTESGLQLDVGPMVKALEYATDRQALVTGKPSTDFFQAATDLLREHDDVVMIGDDIRGDIEASQNAGMKAIQVRTGKFSEADLSLGIQPDAIIDSIKDLPGWWRDNMS